MSADPTRPEPLTTQVIDAVNTAMPCWCDKAYTDRGLIQPDCPRCNFDQEVVDAILALVAPLAERADRAEAENGRLTRSQVYALERERLEREWSETLRVQVMARTEERDEARAQVAALTADRDALRRRVEQLDPECLCHDAYVQKGIPFHDCPKHQEAVLRTALAAAQGKNARKDKALEVAGRAMIVQEAREQGLFHLSQPEALAIWTEAKDAINAALAPPAATTKDATKATKEH